MCRFGLTTVEAVYRLPADQVYAFLVKLSDDGQLFGGPLWKSEKHFLQHTLAADPSQRYSSKRLLACKLFEGQIKPLYDTLLGVNAAKRDEVLDEHAVELEHLHRQWASRRQQQSSATEPELLPDTHTSTTEEEEEEEGELDGGYDADDADANADDREQQEEGEAGAGGEFEEEPEYEPDLFGSSADGEAAAEQEGGGDDVLMRYGEPGATAAPAPAAAGGGDAGDADLARYIAALLKRAGQ